MDSSIVDTAGSHPIPPDVIALIPKQAAISLGVVPYAIDSGGLTVLAPEPANAELANDLAFITGMKVTLKSAHEDLLRNEIRRYYGESLPTDGNKNEIEANGDFAVSDREESVGLATEPQSGSPVSTINGMISDAIRMQASDIHIEPYEKFLRVRFRLDGVLHEMFRQPITSAKAFISRLKIMADLDIAEKRRPQDGRIRVKEAGRVIDIRVSSLPTDFGEKIVLRILDKTQLKLDLTSLGFQENDLKVFEKTIRLPFGMILVTGPTGSGKTTTLYGALNSINRPEVNITTIEDPIEYNLAGINQTQVRSDIGLSFAAVLRSILRQDPNVIMVGEIRDAETAQIAIRAALTGHLVFSTLHTNDGPSALTRLIDMGVEPFLVASSVKMILAQRLLRKVCPECSAPHQMTVEEQEALSANGTLTVSQTYKGKGCPRCNQTGYKGRTAVYEMLSVGNGIADMIARAALSGEIRAKAKTKGMKTLRESALLAAKSGITSLEEVLRETVE